MSPLLILGALALGAYAFGKQKNSGPSANSTVDALIDPTERSSPNVDRARSVILAAFQANRAENYALTAAYIAAELRMPKTAAHLSAWAASVASTQGGTVAGVVGALPSHRRTHAAPPDWMKFQATASKLSGDPAYIRATAETMRRFGYARHAKIHLRAAEG